MLVDADTLTIVSLEEDTLEAQALVGDTVQSTKITVDGYSYVYANLDEAEDAPLEDGTVWKTYHTGYTGYSRRSMPF